MKISVITVCRNAEHTIETTIKSVLGQTCKTIEYVIIDGKSTDKTLNIIRKYKAGIDVLVSEPDKGIYDAMNKGVKKCTGDWIYFLNSGDTFYNQDVITNISRELSKIKDADLVYGNISTDQGLIKFSRVNRFFLIRGTICHQAMFIRKKLFSEFGFFNLNYKIASDYEWLLRIIYTYKRKIKYVDRIIADYSLTGISNNSDFRSQTLSEYSQIRGHYFSEAEIFIYRLYTAVIEFLVKLK
jgi:glycosyltransferase involved in cell wall biosynthesis